MFNSITAQDAVELDLDQMGDECDAKKEGICMKDQCTTHTVKHEDVEVDVKVSELKERDIPGSNAKELYVDLKVDGIRMTGPSRFDYVKYDGIAQATQDRFKKLVQELEMHLEKFIECPRSRASAITNLEYCYMWVGKGIRNDQIKRNKFYELQEERTNS